MKYTLNPVTLLTLVLVMIVPIASLAKQTDSETVYMFNTLPVSETGFAGFLPVMQNNVRNSRKEPGNISFDVFVTENGDSTLYLFEQWKSGEALDQHMQTRHLQAVAREAGDAFKDNQRETSLRLIKLSSSHEPVEILSPEATRNVILTLHVIPEQREKLVDALLEVTAHARLSAGNIRYDLYQKMDDVNTLLVFERWKNVSEHEKHLVQAYNNKLNGIIISSLTQPLVKTRLLLKDVANAP